MIVKQALCTHNVKKSVDWPYTLTFLMFINTIQYPPCNRCVKVLIRLNKDFKGEQDHLPSKTWSSISFSHHLLLKMRGSPYNWAQPQLTEKFGLISLHALLHRSNNDVCLWFQTGRKIRRHKNVYSTLILVYLMASSIPPPHFSLKPIILNSWALAHSRGKYQKSICTKSTCAQSFSPFLTAKHLSPPLYILCSQSSVHSSTLEINILSLSLLTSLL